ncbi:unannotated protein [freshwater metagenome]|uniref:Unannotated protein n=1 Tax=freshwater metagenome TaxID=449393 RepID=A0A6J7PQ34_9ZZZZ
MNSFVNSFSIELCTNNLCADIQACPEERYADVARLRAAAEISASARTTFAALEPSSNTTFLIPAAFKTAKPAGTPPVILIIRTRGSRTRGSIASSTSPMITLNAPSGNPARLNAAASHRAEMGV